MQSTHAPNRNVTRPHSSPPDRLFAHSARQRNEQKLLGVRSLAFMNAVSPLGRTSRNGTMGLISSRHDSQIMPLTRSPPSPLRSPPRPAPARLSSRTRSLLPAKLPLQVLFVPVAHPNTLTAQVMVQYRNVVPDVRKEAKSDNEADQIRDADHQEKHNHSPPPPALGLPSLIKSPSTFFANRAASTSERIGELR